MASLPSFAPFPKVQWRQHLNAQEWESLLEAWELLARACLQLSDVELQKKAKQDDSLAEFLVSFVEETADSGPAALGSQSHATSLRKLAFQLTSRLFALSPPAQLLSFEHLSAFARLYPRKLTAPVLAELFGKHGPVAEASLTALKKQLIPQLEAGIKGDLKLVESQLIRLNPLLHTSPHACAQCLAGSDFFDGLVICFRVMNPPLRKAIITTVYLCLVGLTDLERWAMLNDQLYELKAAADSHKAGPLNVNDSLVPELVTSTPILKVLSKRAEDAGAATANFSKRITALYEFKKGPMLRPKRKRKVDKGKGRQLETDMDADMHVHKMSQITQVQDLFPDLGAGFVARCLDEYGDDVEQVVANLLGESLPAHLATANRSEPLCVDPARQNGPSANRDSTSSHPPPQPDLAPHPTPPQLPTRRNIHDNDEFDNLSADMSKITFGKDHEKTEKEVSSTAPNKAAILSALAALDPDDDERDDTYDAADVGGTVDQSNQEADGANDGNEEILYRAWNMDQKAFGRDAATRRGAGRAKLREETGMTDEAIEGWAVMLTRNPALRRRLEAKYAFSGEQNAIESTSWRANEDNSDAPGPSRGRGRGRGRGGPGRGRGNVSGPTGEKDTTNARKNKEANKGSRANHNRREGRVRKMARGGFAG